jgi:hypothetical protein
VIVNLLKVVIAFPSVKAPVIDLISPVPVKLVIVKEVVILKVVGPEILSGQDIVELPLIVIVFVFALVAVVTVNVDPPLIPALVAKVNVLQKPGELRTGFFPAKYGIETVELAVGAVPVDVVQFDAVFQSVPVPFQICVWPCTICPITTNKMERKSLIRCNDDFIKRIYIKLSKGEIADCE